MPHGVHSKDQLNVRLPPDLLARLKDGSKRHGHTVTDIVTRGTAAELDRLDGIATEPEPVSPPRARSREAPAPAAVPVAAKSAPAGNCDHRVPPGAWCKTCQATKPAKEGKR